MISKITVPNTTFPGLALTQKDFRMNFCINCGSKSLPEEVPIFCSDSLDQQMDEVTSLHMEELLELDAVKRTVYLPKVCTWYLQDFVSSKLIAHPAPIDCLRTISHYTRGEKRSLLVKMLTDTTGPPSIKFKQYSYRCRTIVELKTTTDFV